MHAEHTATSGVELITAKRPIRSSKNQMTLVSTTAGRGGLSAKAFLGNAIISRAKALASSNPPTFV
jgi:hypothetical protein